MSVDESVVIGRGLSPHTHTHRHDSRGCSGLEYVVKVILHLLDPTGPEFSASFVGKLIIAFVKKVSQ